MRYTVKDYWIYLVIGVGLLFVGILTFHRTDRIIVVEDRYWEYTVDIGDYETTSSLECINNKCTLKTDTDWELTCTQSRVGRELPPTAPEINCQDEHRKDYINYYIRYHIEDDPKTRSASFNENQWNQLAPRRVVPVELTLLGRVASVGR